MFETVIQRQAKTRGQAIAFATPSGAATYSHMELDIRRCWARIQPFGIKPGARVLIHVDNTYLHWLLTFALEAYGAISIAIDQHLQVTPFLIGLTKADLVLTDQKPEADPPAPVRYLDAAWLHTTLKFRASEIRPVKRSGDDPVRIIMTSGTTGAPKKILLSRAMLDLRIRDALTQKGAADENFKTITLVGERSIGGYMTGLCTWTIGGSIYSRDFSRDWPSTLRNLKINILVAAPIHIENLLKTLPESFEPVEDLTVQLGGGVLTRDMAELLRQRLTSKVVINYGTTESSGVSYGDLDTLKGAEDSAGFVSPFIEVEIAGASADNDYPEGVGEIRVRGAGVIDGYLDDPEATQKHFRDGWYYPGDLGAFDENGVLRIYGRVDDLMNFRGFKVLPSRVERLVLDCCEVADVAAFATGVGIEARTLWVGYVADRDLDFAFLSARFGVTDVRSMRLEAIPRNAVGKIERKALRERAEALTT